MGRPLNVRLTMNLPVETLFTAALGLQAPWEVKEVDLDTSKRRIDFEPKNLG